MIAIKCFRISLKYCMTTLNGIVTWNEIQNQNFSLIVFFCNVVFYLLYIWNYKYRWTKYLVLNDLIFNFDHISLSRYRIIHVIKNWNRQSKIISVKYIALKWKIYGLLKWDRRAQIQKCYVWFIILCVTVNEHLCTFCKNKELDLWKLFL